MPLKRWMPAGAGCTSKGAFNGIRGVLRGNRTLLTQAGYMKQLAALFKGIAVLIGVFLFVYGIVGFLGFNPAGRHEDLWIKMTGLYMAVIGGLYGIPNGKLAQFPCRRRWYYALTLSPIAVVGVAAVRTINQEGWHDFVLQGGPVTAIVIVCCSVFAPLSLFLYKKG